LPTRLRALGHVEGKNIAIASRFAEGKPEQLPALADELVRLKVEVIIAANTQSIDAAKRATKTTPIVFPVTFVQHGRKRTESRAEYKEMMEQ